MFTFADVDLNETLEASTPAITITESKSSSHHQPQPTTRSLSAASDCDDKSLAGSSLTATPTAQCGSESEWSIFICENRLVHLQPAEK